MPRDISVWILADQLTLNHPALLAAESEVGRENVRVAMVESRAWMHRLPYHRKRQVLVLSAGRHFAAELERAGFVVDLVKAEDSRSGLAAHVKRHGSQRLFTMAAAEYAARKWQSGAMPQELGVPAQVLPNTMFLVGQHDPIPKPEPGHRYVMENFYRAMRRHFGLLIEHDATPTGGKWNLDADNRKPLPKRLIIPEIVSFEVDAITRQVIEEVDNSKWGVGDTANFALAVTREQADEAFAHFLKHRLTEFGPYEDAMDRQNGVLFHSVLSPYMNLGLLEPLAMARAAEAEYRAGRAPLNSVEGFIRQIVGWREFIYWQYHRQMPELRRANGWAATRGMPALFWTGQTEMECLRTVVGRLIASGYTHHIERLMIVCNFCLLAGIDPAAVADWFLTFYIDSHDWVVLPNVIGMGLNADGGVTATKPYVASAAYVNRMSNFCGACVYDPKQRLGETACPFNYLYWNFLIEHEADLRGNPRLGPAVLGLSRVQTDERAAIGAEARRFLDRLELYPSDPPVTQADELEYEPRAGRAMKGVKKADLPEKVCETCGKPFTWRKSLAKNWESVKYCSDACRTKKGTATRRKGASS
jgi:deoxyribodipyrimidine photolyase-related protein